MHKENYLITDTSDGAKQSSSDKRTQHGFASQVGATRIVPLPSVTSRSAGNDSESRQTRNESENLEAADEIQDEQQMLSEDQPRDDDVPSENLEQTTTYATEGEGRGTDIEYVYNEGRRDAVAPSVKRQRTNREWNPEYGPIRRKHVTFYGKVQ